MVNKVVYTVRQNGRMWHDD